ncbi:MAG: tetratricopeptide repeat protein [Azospirillaceae bacterium]|nr:tetratricopeptide repeat protein [Azospirillaceae bacterium]
MIRNKRGGVKVATAIRGFGLGLVVIGLVASGAARAAKPLPSVAPSADKAAELSRCLQQAEQAPEAALQTAQNWEQHGGGDSARLCQAISRFDRGDYQIAAQLFEAIATQTKDPIGAAGLWDRAGWAWLQGEQHDKAQQAYNRAVARQPNDPDLLIDRAFALAAAEKYWDAIDDLTRAATIAPQRFEPWLYRAAAQRALGNFAQARDDIAQALKRAPDNADTLLLYGNLQAASGDRAEAAAAWRRVIAVSPNSDNARTATGNLARMAADKE